MSRREFRKCFECPHEVHELRVCGAPITEDVYAVGDLGLPLSPHPIGAEIVAICQCRGAVLKPPADIMAAIHHVGEQIIALAVETAAQAAATRRNHRLAELAGLTAADDELQFYK